MASGLDSGRRYFRFRRPYRLHRIYERIDGSTRRIDVVVHPERSRTRGALQIVFDAVTALNVDHEPGVCRISTGVVKLVAAHRVSGRGGGSVRPGAKLHVVERLIAVIHLNVGGQDAGHLMSVTVGRDQRLRQRHEATALTEDGEAVGRPHGECVEYRTPRAVPWGAYREYPVRDGRRERAGRVYPRRQRDYRPWLDAGGLPRGTVRSTAQRRVRRR